MYTILFALNLKFVYYLFTKKAKTNNQTFNKTINLEFFVKQF